MRLRQRQERRERQGPRRAVVALLASTATGLLLLLLCSCGYRVVRSDAPFGRAVIAVMPFAEREPVGISAPLADALSRLVAAGGVRLTTDRSAADGILEGEVIAESTRGSPTSGAAAPIPAYLLSVTVQARLIDRHGEAFWQTTLGASEDFLTPAGEAGRDPLAVEASRRSALHRVAQRLARELHEQLVISGSM